MRGGREVLLARDREVWGEMVYESEYFGLESFC